MNILLVDTVPLAWIGWFDRSRYVSLRRGVVFCMPVGVMVEWSGGQILSGGRRLGNLWLLIHKSAILSSMLLGHQQRKVSPNADLHLKL